MGAAARQRALSDFRCFPRKDLRDESSSGVPGAISSSGTRFGTLFRRLGAPPQSWAQFLGGRGSSTRPQNSHPKLLLVVQGFWRKSQCPGTSHAAEGRAVHHYWCASRERNHSFERRSIYCAPAKPRWRGRGNKLSSNHTVARRRKLATGRCRNESCVVPEPPGAAFCREQSLRSPHLLLGAAAKR